MRGDRLASEGQTPWTLILLVLAGLLMIVLVWRFFTSGSATPDIATAPVSIRMTDATTNVILTTRGAPKNITKDTALVEQDQIEVKSGSAKLALLSNPKNSLNLNTSTKIQYLGKNTDNKFHFEFINRDLWINADTSDIVIQIKGLSLTPTSSSVLNISKTDLYTMITVLQGTVTATIDDKTLELTANQQINYSSLRDITLESLKGLIQPINPETLTTPWMTLNGAADLLPQTLAEATTTPPLQNTASVGGGILFASPIDDSLIETKTVTISGKITNPVIVRVIINGVEATIDTVKKSFLINNYPLTAATNDLIYRTYDSAGATVSKGVITVSTNAITKTAQTAPTTPTTPGATPPATTPTNTGKLVLDPTTRTASSYKPDARFRITAPAADFYETTDTNIKIQGSVAANTVAAITVNDYRLTSFKNGGTAWHYFANLDNGNGTGNMVQGTNTYTIRYFNDRGEEIYKQLFVIKKK